MEMLGLNFNSLVLEVIFFRIILVGCYVGVGSFVVWIQEGILVSILGSQVVYECWGIL